MSLISAAKKTFSKKELLLKERYASSKFALVLCSFLFFLNYFLVANSIASSVLSNTVVYSYILLVISLGLFSYYSLANYFSSKLSQGVLLGAAFIISGISLALLSPFVL